MRIPEMTAEDKLEVYRDFILMFNDFLLSGDVCVTSNRVMFNIQYSRLLDDVKKSLQGYEQPTIGRTIKMTEQEHFEAYKKVFCNKRNR